MMGPPQQRTPKLFYAGIGLDDRIPPDHPLRRVADAIDFDVVREKVRPLYGVRGNPSVDPAVLMKFMFLVHFENVASERELLRQLPYRLDWLWFCGYDFDDEVPHHSVLSKARRRWGVDVFSTLFAEVLGACVAADLVGGDVLHVDSSLIVADADASKLQPALRLHGEQLYQRLEEEAEAAPDGQAEEAALALPAQASEDRDLEAGEPAAAGGADEAAGDEAPAEEPDEAPPLPSTPISPTDPDARLTSKYGKTVLGYKDHRGVDDRHGIITSTVTTPASTADGQVLEEVLNQHRFAVGREAQVVGADKAYGTGENYEMMQRRGMTPCVPHQRQRQTPGTFRRDRFRYDAEEDCYVCPAGERLSRRERDQAKQRDRYRAAAGVCAACPLRAQCTDSKRGRTIGRQFLQEYVDWADGCLSRRRRAAVMTRRQIRAEGSFADAANQHGFKRARWRGLDKVRIQNLLIAAAQNVRKLIRTRGPDDTAPHPSAASVSAPNSASVSYFWPVRRPEDPRERSWPASPPSRRFPGRPDSQIP
jgi:IS5 family transposase